MTDNIYNEHGFANRAAYLEGLAEEYDIDLDTVQQAAELLGENEDFEGLISMLDDNE